MKKLGERNYALISRAVKMEGTFNPDVIQYAFIEELYVDEYKDVLAFLKWVHENGKAFGHANYEQVFAEWKAQI